MTDARKPQMDPAMSRRHLLRLGGAAAAGLTLAGCGIGRASTPDRAADPDAGWGGTLLDPPFDKPDVTFTDMNGKPFPFLERTEGKLTVLFFGYTHCPDQCPTFLNAIASGIDAIGTGPGSRPQVLFVGVDLDRDTAEVLKTYLGNIDSSFLGLIPTETALADALHTLSLPPVEIPEPDKDGNYEVGHPSQVTVFSPDNLGHRIYPAVDTRPRQWAEDLPRLDQGTFR